MERCINNDVKVSLKEKLSYSFGDTACNIVYGLTSILTFFYTDYIGIPIGIIGIIILISRVFDGTSDLIMGIITDRTHSKYGKARPWILWMSVPYAISGVLLFTIPPTSSMMIKAVYIFITYNLMQTVCYTAINLPYSSLAALMTRNQQERGTINAFRMAISPFGRMLTTSATLPLVKLMGNTQRAWIIASVFYGILALVLLLICFFNTKERVQFEAKTVEKIPVWTSLKALVRNKYWVLGLLLWAFLMVYLTITGTVLSYYSKYVLGNDLLYSPIYLTEQITLIVVIFTIPFFLKRMTKRTLTAIGAIICILSRIILFFDATNFSTVMVSAALSGIGQAPLMGVIFSFIADAVEYGQWKTHLRQEGLIYSAASVGNKLGTGLTAALISGILEFAGYNGTLATQTSAAVTAIHNLYVYAPIIVWLVIIVLLAFWKLDKMYPSMMQELREREAQGKL